MGRVYRGCAVLIRRGLVLLLLGVTAWTAPSAHAAVADPEPPVLSNFSATPPTLTYRGGFVLLEVDAADADGIDAVGATVYLADGGVLALPLTAEDPRTPDTYSGEVEIPGNVGDDPVSHSVEISARDTVGDETLELMGNIDVESRGPFDEAPDVFDTDLDPTSLPHTGGEVTISASATDDRAISEVYATITDPDGGETVVPLDGVSASRYSAIWTAPANGTPDDLAYTVTVAALDDIGQQDIEDAGAVTVAGDPPTGEPPVLSNFSATPPTLTYRGGFVLLEVDAVDSDGIDDVGATVHLAGGGELALPLLVEDPATPDTFSGEVDIPGNVTDETLTHAVEISARDTVGDETLELMGAIDVEPHGPFDEAPHVFDAVLDPTTLPHTGGDVTISASATDDRAISEVYATITDPEGVETVIPLEGESADRYSATWSVLGNGTFDDVHYDVNITALDDIGQAGYEGTTGLTVRANPPVSLEADGLGAAAVIRAGAGRAGGPASGGGAQLGREDDRVHDPVPWAAVPAAWWPGHVADADIGPCEAGDRALPGRIGRAALVEAAGRAG